MQIWSHIKLWLIISIFSIFFVMATAKPESVYESVQQDLKKLEAVFGKDSTRNLVDRTNSVFNFFFSKNLKPAHDEMRVQNEGARVFRWEGNLVKESNTMLKSAKLEVYNIILRFNIMMMWLPFIILFAGVAIFDGFMMRKVKIASFKYTNPVLYNTFMHGAVFIAGSFMFLMHLPIVMSVWFFPLAGVVLGFFLMFGIMNLQRMGTD